MIHSSHKWAEAAVRCGLLKRKSPDSDCKSDLYLWCVMHSSSVQIALNIIHFQTWSKFSWSEMNSSFYSCNSLTFNIVYCRSCRFFEQFILTTAHSTHQSKHVSHQPIVCSTQSFHSLCNAADHHNGLMANQACIHRKYGHVRALSSRNWANGLGISVWGLVS